MVADLDSHFPRNGLSAAAQLNIPAMDMSLTSLKKIPSVRRTAVANPATMVSAQIAVIFVSGL
ncbi:MAG: hypothetical protein U5K27_01485 [Desulfotignum sp.]|nr:hypothetical protein [Desulfotignum sp.]